MVMAIDNSGAPGNYGSKKSSEYRGSTSSMAAAKKKTAAKKTVVTPGTKVSQATINKVKAMGMTKALKGAANASPEMREALKRLYGAKRVAAAGGSASSGGGKYVGSRFVANTPAKSSGATYKSADAARAAATAKKPTVRIPAKSGFGGTNMPNTPSTRANSKAVTMPNTPSTRANSKVIPLAKKSGTTDPFAKFVFGAAKALRGGSNQGMTAAQVAAENKRRAAAVAKAKANKNK